MKQAIYVITQQGKLRDSKARLYEDHLSLAGESLPTEILLEGETFKEFFNKKGELRNHSGTTAG